MNRELLIYLLTVIIYITIILIPVFTYISRKENKDVFKYLKLKGHHKRGIIIGIVISSIYLGFFIVKAVINENVNISLDIGIAKWLSGLSVGFIEEIPVRGFLLNKFQDKFSFFYSNIFVTLIFVFLHFPTWIIRGTDIPMSMMQAGFISLAFGYLVKEYDSLWPSIICHSVYNLGIWIGLV